MNFGKLTPSKIACDGLGLEPGIGAPAGTDGHCSLCGAAHAAGDHVVAWRPGENFNDQEDLAAPTGAICRWCAPLTSKSALLTLGAFCATPQAVYPLYRNESRVWFLTDPPAPPFVAAVSIANLQHLVWRTPLTLSRDLIQIRVGGQVLSIDRPLLFEALEIWQACEKQPLAVIDRKINNLAHGLPRSTLADDPKVHELFLRLGPGEIWALSAFRAGVEPVRPEPIRELKGIRRKRQILSTCEESK